MNTSAASSWVTDLISWPSWARELKWSQILCSASCLQNYEGPPSKSSDNLDGLANPQEKKNIYQAPKTPSLWYPANPFVTINPTKCNPLFLLPLFSKHDFQPWRIIRPWRLSRLSSSLLVVESRGDLEGCYCSQNSWWACWKMTCRWRGDGRKEHLWERFLLEFRKIGPGLNNLDNSERSDCFASQKIYPFDHGACTFSDPFSLSKSNERLFSGWWLNQPLWKICSSKWLHLPPIFVVKIKNMWNHYLALWNNPHITV